MEHTRWVFCAGGDSCTFNFIGDYFVNMNGQPCRRNGGVYDGFANDDTLLVENCTHVMAQGSVYKLRSNLWERVMINHNTFVNMAGYVFMSLGYQSHMSVTNNLFINCGVQPYPGIQSIDNGEQDIDWIPMGLVNVYPDSADVAIAPQGNSYARVMTHIGTHPLLTSLRWRIPITSELGWTEGPTGSHR